ncbi:MAG: hypothetical protein Q4D98_14470 [Planctomycetia bacterium]|nr:hypothetical protein [Planctomycetia bacterium]
MLKILYDIREKKPYKFAEIKELEPDATFSVAMRSLSTGDYTAEGLEEIAVIERKSPRDFLNTLTQAQDRFMREFRRMNGMPFAAIVVETRLEALAQGSGNTALHLQKAVAEDGFFAKMLLMRILFPNIRWYFAASRAAAEFYTYKQLNYWYKKTYEKQNVHV